MKNWLMCVLIVCVMGFAGGCSPPTIEQTQAAVATLDEQAAQISEVVQVAKAQLVAAEAQIAALPPGEARDTAERMRAEALALIDKGEPTLAKVQASLALARARLEGATDGVDAAAAAIEAAQPWVPAPYNLLIPWAAAGLLGIRNAYNRWRGWKLASSVQDLVMPGGCMSEDTAKKLSAAQGAGVKAIVDEAQGKKLKIPI